MFKLLNTEPKRFTPEALALMGEGVLLDNIDCDRAKLLEIIEDYDGIFIALRNVIDAEVLQRATRLKLIVTPTTGLNHIDLKVAQARGITVLSLKGETEFLENVTATAEHTWGLLLALCRKIPAAHQSVLSGAWKRDLFYGTELKNKTLGILGCGRLGKMVAKIGATFRMRVLAHDTDPQVQCPEARFVSMDELLASSDVLSIHVPFTEATRNLIDADKIARLKKGAFLLNTARGEVVEEGALLAALTNGHLAGAALDVLARETAMIEGWPAGDPLWLYARAHDNLILTPHIGGATHDSMNDTNIFMIRKMARYLAQKGSE